MPNTYQNILNKTQFEPNKDWLQIKTIDMHTGGEPLRVILDGFPELKGNSVLEYRRYCKENFDHLRTALMFEPRGHADMYGCILLPPNDNDEELLTSIFPDGLLIVPLIPNVFAPTLKIPLLNVRTLFTLILDS